MTSIEHYVVVIATDMCDGQVDLRRYGAHIIIMAQRKRIGPITQGSVDRNNLMITRCSCAIVIAHKNEHQI